MTGRITIEIDRHSEYRGLDWVEEIDVPIDRLASALAEDPESMVEFRQAMAVRGFMITGGEQCEMTSALSASHRTPDAIL